MDQTGPDTVAAPGECVRLRAAVSDPDGDTTSCRWSLFAPDGTATWEEHELEADFVVPADAASGDRFVLTLTVRDNAARPATRYAQVEIRVTS